MGYSEERLEAAAQELLALKRQTLSLLEKQQQGETHLVMSNTGAVLRRVQESLREQMQALEQRLYELRGPFAADSQLSEMYYGGVAAATPESPQLELLRGASPSRRLCDAHTSLSSLSIGYAWLHSASLALSDHETAELARRHRAVLVALASDLEHAISAVTTEELCTTPATPVELAPVQGREGGYHPHAG